MRALLVLQLYLTAKLFLQKMYPYFYYTIFLENFKANP